MRAMQFLLWIVVGAITGWVTGRRMKGLGYGPLIDVVMGAAGGAVGGLMMQFAGGPGQGELIKTSIAAILGSVGFTALSAFMSGKGRYAQP